MAEAATNRREIEWPTLLLLAVCYGLWAVGTTWLAQLWLPLSMIIVTLMIAMHSSLSHEVLHGHPFRNAQLNEALVFPCLGLFIPFRRFRDLHLAHHVDSILTDPYDDPETNYLDPKIWQNLSKPLKWVLYVNNTLAGRLLFGPAVSMWFFLKADIEAMRRGDKEVKNAWMVHIPATAPVLVWLYFSAMPLWAYLIAAYCGFSILKIRTFLEHRAHERADGRTVVIEDRGPLALIFLNNNLHAVHHKHPKAAWYRLPKIWSDNRDRFLQRNDGYYYSSYREIFARHFWRTKDPVVHPLWSEE
ncbi:MAG: fatty acid desaturase [Pseudomonadota bacterium]